MKLIVVIMTTFLMQVAAAGFAQKITLNEKGSSLENVIQKIRTQTGYDFVYEYKLIENAKKVTVNVKNSSLEEVLEKVFKDQAVSYSIKDNVVVLDVKQPSFLERVKDRFFDIGVNGVVLDSAGKPLPGASITIKGTLRAVTSGDAGQFYLPNVKENSILVISYIGFATQEVLAVGNTLMQIRMVATSGNLQEVVVNAGYYTVKETERTGSISRITSKEIEKQPVTNILATMQGNLAGVKITQVTGVPGGAFKIEIRGKNNIIDKSTDARDLNGRNSPLYIVDGMPYSSQQLSSRLISTEAFQGFGPSPLNNIDPSSIESVEILKDADATAIYGSRGANGVVLITTKKGKIGKTLLSVNAYSGSSKITRKLDLMNTQQYLEMRKEALSNDVNGADYKTHPYYPYYPEVNGTWDESRYTDWQKELIGNTANTYNVNASISGGSANTQFLVGGAYSKETTVFPGDFAYNKGSINFNLTHKSNDQKFSITLTSAYGGDNNNLPFGDLTPNAFALAPNAPALYKENGELNWENSTWSNPLGPLENKIEIKANTLNTTAVLGYKILSSLELTANLGFMDRRFFESHISPLSQYDPAYAVYNINIPTYTVNNGKIQSWNIEPQLIWKHQLYKGLLTIQVGTTFLKESTSLLANTGEGFPSNNLITNLSAASTTKIENSSNSEYRYNAVFSRINYNLNEKYILNLTGRRDGSSRFGPGKQFGNFGAFGAAWLFNKENFINQLVPFLSFGKLRASYGITGSDGIGNYEFLDTYTVVPRTTYQNVIGLQPSRLYNPDFSWENTKKLELALDLGFIKDRIFLTIARYRNRSSNQLIGYQLPAITGFDNIRANLNATIQNTGWELELRTINLDNKQLRWSTSVNFSTPRNKLISFPGLEGSTYAQYYVIGQSTNIQKVYHYKGINTQTGIYQFEDYNNDGGISYANDAYKIMNLNPKFLGGLQNNITYKNLELDFTFYFVKQQAGNFNSTAILPGGQANQPIDLLGRWQKVGDIKPFQKYTSSFDQDVMDAQDRLAVSDAAVSDASFIRLKNLSLAYTLPKSILKTGSCRVYIQGENLLTITHYKGTDPETQSFLALPALRVITAGLQLNF